MSILNRRATRTSVVALVAAGALTMGANAAYASYTSKVDWGKIGDQYTGQAYGNIQNENRTTLYVGNWHRAVTTGTYNYDEAWPTWYLDGGGTDIDPAKETGRTSSTAFQWQVLRFPLVSTASKVRATIQTCLDISYRPDSCSSQAVPSFTY